MTRAALLAIAQASDLVVVDGADHNYNRLGKAAILIEHVVYFLLHGEVLPQQGDGTDGVQRFPRKPR